MDESQGITSRTPAVSLPFIGRLRNNGTCIESPEVGDGFVELNIPSLRQLSISFILIFLFFYFFFFF